MGVSFGRDCIIRGWVRWLGPSPARRCSARVALPSAQCPPPFSLCPRSPFSHCSAPSQLTSCSVTALFKLTRGLTLTCSSCPLLVSRLHKTSCRNSTTNARRDGSHLCSCCAVRPWGWPNTSSRVGERVAFIWRAESRETTRWFSTACTGT